MIQLIRGFKDILPGEVELWQEIERIARDLLEDFGFREIRIPIMERTELFARSIGEDTDIVESTLFNCIVMAGARIHKCDLENSIIGPRSIIKHTKGQIIVGSDAVVQGNDNR